MTVHNKTSNASNAVVAAILGALVATDQDLYRQFADRVRRHEQGDTTAFPEQVVGLGTLRVFGAAGDAPVAFPRVRQLSDMELLPADVQLGLTVANQVMTAYQGRGVGRMVYEAGESADLTQAEPVSITQISPVNNFNVLVVAPISGG